MGVALSDEMGEFAFPLTTIDRAQGVETVAAIAALVRAHKVTEIVVGLALRLDGREGPEAKRARVLARELERAAGVTVVLWDERMTSALANRSLSEGGLASAKARLHVDEAAATVLLQSYLAARRPKP